MKTTINFYGNPTEIEIVKLGKYPSYRPAIGARSNGGPFGTITVNVPYADLEEGEHHIKVHSENSWVPQLLELLPNVFKDTGKTIPSGYVDIPIWKIDLEKLK